MSAMEMAAVLGISILTIVSIGAFIAASTYRRSV